MKREVYNCCPWFPCKLSPGNALLAARDIDSRTLAGMSMGGFIALRFAGRYPGRLDAGVNPSVDFASTFRCEREVILK
jgi:hypothetical protein